MIRRAFLLLAFLAIASCVSRRSGELAGLGVRPPREMVSSLDDVIRDAELRGSIVGGQLAVVWRGELVYSHAFGHTNIDEEVRITKETLFDTASLTKPVAGVSWFCEFLPPSGLTGFREELAILSHSTPWCDEANYPANWTKSAVLKSLREPITCKDSPHGVYSNFAYAKLSFDFSKEHGLRLPASLPSRVAEVMPLSTFLPDGSNGVAASGTRSDGSALQGAPHDPLADFMIRELGLLPLHSGLFSTAQEVAGFARATLRREGEPWATISSFLLGVVRLREEAIGAPVHRSAGGLLSPVEPPYADPGSPPGRYFVQTGYTGCLLWLDAEESAAVALLTNASLNASDEEFEELAARIVKIVRTSRR